MCKVLEDMRNETIEKVQIENAKSLLQLGKLTVEEIANAIGLSVDKVNELSKATRV
ncbi:MAG: hypothetical protein IJ794_17325 [Lachnospiraceae bacterium]|nr:hypothetical protein [Lachnospiraceae bacterium]